MFTQRCFIRESNPDVIRKLIEIGYNFVCPSRHSKKQCIFCYGEYAVSRTEAIIQNDWIDCGTNEELFLAIAALRDDSDKNQWFTDVEYWNLCKEDDWDINEYKWAPNIYFHKATVQELIEHFNK